jgi:hypothetical protein
MTAQGGDILAWLESAIMRRESAAKSASPGPWVPGGIGDYGWTVHTGVRSVETEDSEIGQADAKHIALNSPSATLRRCAADRKLLELHRPDGSACVVCAGPEESDENSEGEYEWSRPGLPFPCPTVVAIAEGYGWTGGER